MSSDGSTVTADRSPKEARIKFLLLLAALCSIFAFIACGVSTAEVSPRLKRADPPKPLDRNNPEIVTDSALPGAFVDVRGGRLWVVAHGSGPAVLLLHGVPSSSYLWRNVQRMLADSYYTLAPDLVGLGRSSAGPRAKVSTAAQAEHLHDLLDQLNLPRVVLVGHDVGAAVAVQFAVRYPQRVSRVMLVSGALLEEFWPITSVSLLRLPILGDLISLVPYRRIVAQQVRRGIRCTAPSAKVIKHYSSAVSSYHDRRRLLRFFRALDPQSVEEKLSVFSTLQIPTSLLWGERDPFQPVKEAKLLRAALDAELTLLPGAAHFLPEECPTAVAESIRRFIAGEGLSTRAAQ